MPVQTRKARHLALKIPATNRSKLQADPHPIPDYLAPAHAFPERRAAQAPGTLCFTRGPLDGSLARQGAVEPGELLLGETHPERRARPALLHVQQAPLPPVGPTMPSWRCAPPMTDTRSARGGGHSGCL